MRSCNARAGAVGLARHRRKTDTATDGRQMNDRADTLLTHVGPSRCRLTFFFLRGTQKSRPRAARVVVLPRELQCPIGC